MKQPKAILSEDPREWRKNVLATCVVLELIGLYRRGRFSASVFSILQVALAVVVIAAIAKPRWCRGFYRFRMTLNHHVGGVLTRVALTLFYFAALTPLGWFLRLTGRDLLGLRRRPPGESYWRKCAPPSSFDRLF